MDLILEEPEETPLVALVATPLQSMPSAEVPRTEMELVSSDSSATVGITRVVSETEESSRSKRKRSPAGAGVGTSKRRRHVIFGGDESSEDAEKDASSPSATKDASLTSSPK